MSTDGSSISTSVTLGPATCVVMDPNKYPQAIGKANGYVCPIGPEPGIGYALLLQSDLDNLDISTPYSLTFTSSSDSAELGPLYIVNATQISGGAAYDPNSVYLVRLADVRMPARLSSITVQINVRCPAPPRTSTAGSSSALEYYIGSLNSGAVYTWTAAIEEIWNAIGALSEYDYPGLPYSPNGTPEGFNLIEVNAWQVLNDMLARIGCVFVYDPVGDDCQIQQLGQEQFDLDFWLADAGIVIDDAAPYTGPTCIAPYTIRTCFNRVEQNYGTQADTPRDETAEGTASAPGNFATDPYQKVDNVTDIEGAVAGTILTLWDDLTAIAKFDGTILNSSALTSRATERTNNWVADYNVSYPFFRQVYSGVQEFLPGTQLKYVYWRNFGVGRSMKNGKGCVTEIGCYPGLPKITDAQQGIQIGWSPLENLFTPDMCRKTWPLYPNVCQWVTVTSGTAGQSVTPTYQGLFEGLVTRIDPTANMTTSGAYHTNETCWIVVVDSLTGSVATSPTLISGERYLGRLNGSFLYSGSGYPLYAIHKGAGGTLIATGVLGSSLAQTDATASVGSITPFDGSTVSGTVNATNYGFMASNGATVIMALNQSSGTWSLLNVAHVAGTLLTHWNYNGTTSITTTGEACAVMSQGATSTVDTYTVTVCTS
jgi:hypothetical protein